MAQHEIILKDRVLSSHLNPDIEDKKLLREEFLIYFENKIKNYASESKALVLILDKDSIKSTDTLKSFMIELSDELSYILKARKINITCVPSGVHCTNDEDRIKEASFYTVFLTFAASRSLVARHHLEDRDVYKKPNPLTPVIGMIHGKEIIDNNRKKLLEVLLETDTICTNRDNFIAAFKYTTHSYYGYLEEEPDILC